MAFAPSFGMKVFYVGDNRTALNWGRSASLALGQLLSGEFEITGRVSGEFFDLEAAEAGYVGTLMPAKYYRFFQQMMRRRRERWIFGAYARVETLFGAKDFITEDPAESVDHLLAHKDQHAALRTLYDQAKDADAIVIDGDGDIIFTTPPRRQALFMLAMIELGIRLQKPVFLVNSMISDSPSTGRNERTFLTAKNLFARCRAVVLRDPESLEYVRREMPAVNASLTPDSLFAWFPLYEDATAKPPVNGDFLLPHPELDAYWGKLDFSKPYICIGGGALAASQPARAAQCYSRLVDAVRDLGCAVYLTENDAPDSFLQRVAAEKNVGIVPANAPILMCGAVLANARLFISGRYHPSIFASLGGTPCIFLASHAHKMGSLPRLLEYDDSRHFDAFPGEADIAGIVTTARRYLAQGEELRTKIRNVARSRCNDATRLPAFIREQMHG